MVARSWGRRPALVRSGCIAALVVLAGLMPSAPVNGLEVMVYYPNLRALRPYEFRIGSPDEGFIPPYVGEGAIRFDTGVLNVGYAALELIVVPTGSDQGTLTQCTGWQGDVCLGRQVLGTIPWHREHPAHFHLSKLLVYELRRLDPQGDVDFSPEGLVSTAGRSSLCLLDNGRVEYHEDYERTATNSFPHQFLGCSHLRSRLSPGWMLLVHNQVFEQFMPIDSVPDGDYAIVVKLNADRMIVETKYDDNVSYRKIRLSDGGHRVEAID